MHAAELVSVNSKREQEFLESEITGILPRVRSWWTGARQGAEYGSWLWADGECSSYTAACHSINLDHDAEYNSC